MLIHMYGCFWPGDTASPGPLWKLTLPACIQECHCACGLQKRQSSATHYLFNLSCYDTRWAAATHCYSLSRRLQTNCWLVCRRRLLVSVQATLSSHCSPFSGLLCQQAAVKNSHTRARVWVVPAPICLLLLLLLLQILSSCRRYGKGAAPCFKPKPKFAGRVCCAGSKGQFSWLS